MASDLAKMITQMALDDLIRKEDNNPGAALCVLVQALFDELTDAELNRINQKLVDSVVGQKGAA